MGITKELKVGTVLIAKNRCRMDSGECTLTKGREYSIHGFREDTNELIVIDDYNDEHFYNLAKESPSYFGRFFKLK